MENTLKTEDGQDRLFEALTALKANLLQKK